MRPAGIRENVNLFFVSFLLGLGQGVLHAAGPDHVAAMATLGHDRRRALSVALRFALGHAIVLGSVALFCLLLGVGLSEAFERWAEIAGGLLLLTLALARLFFPTTHAHGHPHLGEHGPRHEHVQLPLAAGALLAVSGVRSLLLAVPPLLVGQSASWTGLWYLPGFAVGILLGMGALGFVWAATMERLHERLFSWVHKGVTLATFALGVFWVAVRL